MIELKILFITGPIVLFLLLLLRSRVWVLLEHEASGLHVWAGMGPFYLSVFPAKPKSKERKEASTKKKKAKLKKDKLLQEETKKSGVSLELFREVLDLGLKTARRFQRNIRIDMLQMSLTWGAEDPADAAISYGYAHAVVSGLLALLEVNFQVKEKLVRIQLDYTLDKPNIYVKTSCSLTMFQALSLGCYAGVRAFDIYRKKKHKNKEILKKAV